MKKSPIILIIGLLIGAAIGYIAATRISNNSHTPTSENSQIEESREAEIWTCSMHPQIQQPESGDCPICGMDLILLDKSTSSNDPLVLEMTPESAKLANIQTTIVGEIGKAEKSILLNGKIQVDERRTASQAAHVPGRIEELFITFTGERVKKGQKLATIYSPDLVTAQQELLEALKFVDVNSNLVEAARKKLRFWKISAENIKQIETTGKVQETFTIYAETSGVVSERKIALGDYVKKGQVLFEIINLNKLWVLFDGYEEDLANVHVGDRIEFTTPALPGKIFQTRINYIDPVINPQTRVAALRADISNSTGSLKPEMFVKGEVKANLSTDEKLTLPKSAVLWTGKRSVVYIKLPNMTVPSFKYREIDLGASLGNSYLIKGGLEVGEEVVTYGSFAIDAAAQLNNQQSMMNKVVKIKGMPGIAPSTPHYMAETPSKFKAQLNVLVKAYFDLKDALVATDAASAAKTTEAFLTQLGKVDMSLVKGDAHLYWMDQLNGMTGHTEQIGKEEDIEKQRTQFAFLSGLLIQTLEAFGYEGEEVYIQHCPMAMDNEGADWISTEKQIKNPYYGDKMIKCGSITGTFPMEMEETPATSAKAPQGHNH